MTNTTTTSRRKKDGRGVMKPKVIRIVDLGFHDDFTVLVESAADLIDSQDRGRERARAHVEMVRTRDEGLVDAALVGPAALVHLSSHGGVDDEGMWLSSHNDDFWYSLGALGDRLQDWQTPIGAPVVLIDACASSSEAARRNLRRCIERETLLVGSPFTTYWDQTAPWATAFYAAFLRARGKGRSAVDWADDATTRANDAFETLTGNRSPFRTYRLTPDRSAKRAFS